MLFQYLELKDTVSEPVTSTLFENGLTLSPYNFITILIATGVCALVAFLYYRFCYDSFKKLLHRQKLARMVLENKWYEADTVQDSGFFTDLQSRSRVLCPYFINGNAVCYHIIKQDIFDISVMQGLVGQLTIQATFQFIL